MQSLHIADTWGPTRPLNLALGGSGTGLHRCQQVPPKYTTATSGLSWTVLAPWGPAQLEIKHEHSLLLVLFPAPQLGWGEQALEQLSATWGSPGG